MLPESVSFFQSEGTMAKNQYLVSVNGKGSSIVYGAVQKTGSRPSAIPMRLKDAEELAMNWPATGQVVIYKLVPVKNFWHDPPSLPAKDQ